MKPPIAKVQATHLLLFNLTITQPTERTNRIIIGKTSIIKNQGLDRKAW